MLDIDEIEIKKGAVHRPPASSKVAMSKPAVNRTNSTSALDR